MLGQIQVDPNAPTPLDQELARYDDPSVHQMSPEDMYWATREAKDVISELQQKEETYFKFAEDNGFIPMWRHMTAQYYGQDPMTGEWVTQVVGFDGPQGELVRFRVNETRSFMKQLITMAIGTRPAFECSATNSDYDSIGQAETADSIISYVYQANYGERKERRTVERAMLVGIGWSWCNWDVSGGEEIEVPVIDPATGQPPMQLAEDGMTMVPVLDPETGEPPMKKERTGALVLKSLAPWDVIGEVMIEDADDHLWRMVRERRSKHELAGRFKELREQLRGAAGLDKYVIEELLSVNSQAALMASKTDEVIVKHFYHVPSPAMTGTPYERGRYLVFVDDIPLIDISLPYNVIPLIDLCPSEFIGTSFGYSDAWDLCALNQMQDQVVSDVASNLTTFGRQLVSIEDGSDVTAQDLANGLRVITRRPGSSAPEGINLSSIPNGSQWFLDYIAKRFQSISSLNSVSRGDPEANITSGQMAALFHSIALEANSAMQLAVDTHRERLANLILDILKQYAHHPMIVRIAGADERPYLDTFTRDKLLGVRGVTIKTANPMMRTQAGRLQLAEFAMKIPGAITDPAQVTEIFVSGQVKPLYDQGRKRRMRIKLEDEMLLSAPPIEEAQDPAPPPLPNGMQMPAPPPYKHVPTVPVHWMDDHDKHVNQHYALLASREALENQALWQAVNVHIEHHYKVWKETDPARLAAAKLVPYPQPAMPAGGPGGPPDGGGMSRVGPPGAPPANDNGEPPEVMMPTDMPQQQTKNNDVPIPKPARSPIPNNMPQAG